MMFQGAIKDFRSQGGLVKTEEEKKAMAEKHRFKRHREDFKQRFEQQDENEEGDIRTFQFHSLRKNDRFDDRRFGEGRKGRGFDSDRRDRRPDEGRRGRGFDDDRRTRRPAKTGWKDGGNKKFTKNNRYDQGD